MSPNVLDIVFAALLISFALISAMRGAVKELLSLVGLIGGFFLANWFYRDLAGQVDEMLPDPVLAELISYLAIFVAGYLAGIFLSGLGEAFRPHQHDMLNRMLGGAIGAVKGITISLVLFWVINSYFPPFQDELGDSVLGEQLGRLFSAMEDFDLI